MDGKGPYKANMSYFFKIKNFATRFDNWIKEGHAEKVEGGYSKQLCKEIITLLKQCQHSHPSNTVQEKASKVLIELNQIDPDTVQLSSSSNVMREFGDFPSRIFEDALGRTAAWLPGIQSIKHHLEQDEQLENETDFYISPLSKDTKTKKEEELAQQIKEFLNGTGKVLLIEAPMGAGKSLALKKMASSLWDEFKSTQYIPIFGSLPTFDNPTKIIDELLKEHILEGQKKELQALKIVWFLDAVDELKISEEKLFNLYTANGFQNWEHCKIIFTCRAGHFKDGYKEFLYTSKDELKQIDILSFRDNKIEEYLKQYLKKCEEKNIPILWKDLSKYLEYLKTYPNIKELIQSPFLLRIMADTLPHIVKMYEKDPNELQNLTDTHFMDAIFCRIVERELRKFNIRYRNDPSNRPKKQNTLIIL